MAFAHIFLAIHFVAMMSIYHDGIAGIKKGLKNAGWWILLVAVFTVGYRLSQSYAMQNAEAALVSGIKRSAALFATIIGGKLFHEKNLFRKAIACILMIGGVILIIL